jgi:hypothetical protein
MSSFKYIDYPGGLYHSLTNFYLGMDNYAQILWQFSAIIWVFSLLWSAYKSHESKLAYQLFYPILMIGFLWLRLPGIVADELNGDESEWMVGAATLSFDPRFWLSVDGTTSGPLNIFPLCLINLLGFGINHANTRLLNLLLLTIPSIIFFSKAVHIFSSVSVARFCTAIYALFLGLMNHYDFNSYNSEQVSIFILSISCFLTIKYLYNLNYQLIIINGFLLGLLPFAKLQSLPIGAVLGVGMLFAALIKYRYTHVLVLCIATITPTLIILIYVFKIGIFNDFYQSYIANNLLYGGSSWKYIFLGLLGMIFIHTKIAVPFYFTTLLMILIGLLFIQKPFKKQSQTQFIIGAIALLSCFAAYYAIGKPNTGFPHYQLFMIFPLMLLLTYIAHLVWENKPKLKDIFFVLSLVSPIWLVYSGNAWLKELSQTGKAKLSPVAEFINNIAKPNDRLVVMGSFDYKGWNHNKLYIETEMIQGTRESHTQRQEGIIGFEQQSYYLERFVKDIDSNKPTIIADIYGDSCYHSAFPVFDKMLIENYSCVGIVNMPNPKKDFNIRVYKIKLN